ncbi:DUF6701 domain-containing protein [Silanimonas sp.]|uniref:DUF6701 domain-containing protein n=1 Tax=Silanimonas sp. TaxID=1929290 RepID=UPI0022CCDC24|nr:DUF6701 domain-containing protein [Silanimonas sp.]MCZ8165284.1 hypothetical protein [Silanimonas sp.]
MIRHFVRIALVALALLASVPAFAQISTRATSQGGVATGTLSLPKPAGTNTGDVLVAAVTVVPALVTVNTPTGWVLQFSDSASANARLAVFTRVVPAGDSAVTTYAFTFRSSFFLVHSGAAGGIVGFIGVDNTVPVDVSARQATAAAFAHAAPSVTTTARGDVLVAAFAMPGSTDNWFPPSGMVEAVDATSSAVQPSTNGVSLTMAVESRPVPGATGTRTAIADSNGLVAAAGRTASIALRPALAPAVSRYRIEHDGNANSCAAETVTIRACATADCSSLSSAGATGTLSAGGNSVPFSIPVGQTSTSVSMLVPTTSGPPDPEAVRFAISAVSPAPALVTSCRNGVGTVDSAGACDISVSESGFVISVPDHVSDTPQTATISAVQRSNNNTCTPLFANVTRSVGFWATYLNPASGTRSVNLGGSNLVTASPGTALSLAFNASGVATTSLRYADVGQMQLQARYVGSSATGDAGLTVTGVGSTGTFIAKPARFLLTIPGHNASVAVPGDATRPVFGVAGVPFNVSVEAQNASNVATPNFGRESTAEGVAFDAILTSPVGGVLPEPPAPSVTIASGLSTWTNGASSGTLRFDEVGVITLRPRLASRPYLNYSPSSDDNVVGADVDRVGRFRPARLAVVPNTPVLANACAAGTFGYVGQDFGFSTLPELTVSGVNALGNTTRNYVNGSGAANAYWRYAGTLANRSYTSAVSPATAATLSRTTNGGAAIVSDNTAAPFDGTGRVSINGDRLTWAKPATPEGPFTPRMSLALTASDLTDSDGVCFDTSALDGCDPLTITGFTGPLGSQQRWGRVAVTNAFGPEVIDLQVPMRAEFFNGTAFVANTDDFCTGVTLAPLVDANAGDTLLPSETCVQDSGSPGASGQGCSVAGPVARRYSLTPPTGNGGNFTLWLRAPGAGNVGILDLTPTVPAWLQFNWRGTGSTAPTARIGFGVYQGDRRAIHEREVY